MKFKVSKKILLIGTALFLITNIINAQQSILTKSGKKIEISDIKIDSSEFIYYKKTNGKVKWIEAQDIFSWTRKDSVEVIFYKPDCEDVCFKISQMRDYLHGLADAKKEYKAPGALIIGFTVGAVSGFLTPAYLSPVAPAANSIIFGATKPKEKDLKIKTDYIDNSHYLEGYKRGIRKKRTINSIVGGGVGVIVGILTAVLVSNNQ